jgi:hypothetical protein
VTATASEPTINGHLSADQGGATNDLLPRYQKVSNIAVYSRIRELRAQGLSWPKVARAIGCSVRSAYRTGRAAQRCAYRIAVTLMTDARCAFPAAGWRWSIVVGSLYLPDAILGT